jgi:hypothetical protein
LTDNTYLFTKENDETAAKSLIKFFYSGIFEYSSEEAVVTFMLLANKFKVKDLTAFKVPAKVYLNGIISYIEKDLTNRLSEFDTLAESVDFKKMEKEDLTKLYSKKKWLQKSSTFLSQIIAKDMDDDEDDDDSKSDKSEEEEEEEEEDEEEGGSSVEYDPKASHSSWQYNKKTKFFTCQNSSWYTAISKKPTTKFTVELGTGVGSYMVGFIKKQTYNQNSSNYSNGHFWYGSSSGLYGPNQLSFSLSAGCSQGTKIGAVFIPKKGIVQFYQDGVYKGDAFKNEEKKLKLHAAIDCCSSGSNFKFIKGKYKKK